MADGNLTIDEIMALGEAHTKATIKKKKIKKKKKVMPKINQKKKGLAESGDMLDQAMAEAERKQRIFTGGLKSVVGAL